MKNSLYIYQNGTLERKDNTLRFVNESQEKKDIPVNAISEIYFFGENKINTKLITFLSQNQIICHFFNYYDFYTSSLVPKKTRISGKLLVKQVEYYSDYNKRLKLAKKFIEAASNNIFRNLRYYNGRGKNLSEEMSIIKHLNFELDGAKTVSQVMGIEGNIRKTYYQSWNKIINQDIQFEKRVKRPPDNVINTLISYMNALLYTTVLSEIYKTQLNPTISYLHEPGTSRFSLSLDISEIFKPLIVDRLIFSLLNKNQIQEKHFDEELNYTYIKETGSKIILSEYDNVLKRTITQKELSKKVSYRYLIRLECYKIIKQLLEDKQYEPFVMWW